MTISSMVVNDLDRIGAVACPHKTDAPLIVMRMLCCPFRSFFNGFEPIGRGYLQVNERLRLSQHEQLPQATC